MESSKLTKASGEPLRALQELENAMQSLGFMSEVLDLTGDTDRSDVKVVKAKVGR